MSIGIWQILLVVLLIVILFGAGRIPRIMGDVAKGIKSFKQGMNDDDNDEKNSSDPNKLESHEEDSDNTPKH